ncbi:hypothetical protein [Bacillus nakamurai]|uniref:hypothetical protein n=1 Tax=Bacillus nakamurai TaxID=1793963 RepID=UPI0020C34F44|nr:hypothetical protein [Bacillus nakamurai]MCP6680742.1 hypothetical protein [Bacillus nakamurai]
MSELAFTRINTSISNGDQMILAMNAAEFIVLAQEKTQKDKYINHIFLFQNSDGQLLNRYQIETSKDIICVQKSGASFLFLINREYEDGVVHEEPNIYMWHPIRGFYHSFYGGRYIRSMTIDSSNNLWLGYDEAGIFSCLDDDISLKGVNPFTFKNGTWKLCFDSFSTAPHLVDHFYDAFADKDAIYLHYCALGQDYIQKIGLHGETLGFHKVNFDFSAQFRRDSFYYFLIQDQSSYLIEKAMKSHDMEHGEEYTLTDKSTRKHLRFTQVAVYQDKVAGIDERNRLYLLNDPNARMRERNG